jgi:hypothetical protein
VLQVEATAHSIFIHELHRGAVSLEVMKKEEVMNRVLL